MVSLGGLLGESEVPTVCHPADEATLDTPARLRVTMCAARVRMASLTHLEDTDVSTVAIEAAAAPTFAVLDEVVASGDPRWQSVALELRGDLYVAMAARFRHANASPWRVTPWLASARRAYSQARKIIDAQREVVVEQTALR